MTAVITLTLAGTDTGPFNLFTDVDNFTSAFKTNISKSSLLLGVPLDNIPDYTGIIKIKSTGKCLNETIVYVVS